MSAVGGSIESVILEGRSFPVASDAEAQVKLGGFENEQQSNGDGSTRLIKTRVPWAIDGVVVEIDNARGDHEYIQELSDRNSDFTVAITYASGDVYQGVGQIVGETQASTQSASAPISLMGPGKLTKQ
jgi:hypothetical protein